MDGETLRILFQVVQDANLWAVNNKNNHLAVRKITLSQNFELRNILSE